MGGCDWVWVGVTGCGWYLFRILLWVAVGVCDCLKHIHEWVYLSRGHL